MLPAQVVLQLANKANGVGGVGGVYVIILNPVFIPP